MDKETILSRREFLFGATMLACGSLLIDVAALAKLSGTAAPYPGGELLGALPFIGEVAIAPGKLWSSGLDARLYTDLSRLSPDALITPTDKFYVRTACPDLIDYKSPWTIKIVTPSETRVLPIKELESKAKKMGLHLMECAGNDKGGQFGLMSACKWDGVLLAPLLKSMKLKSESKYIRVSGFDSHSQPSLGVDVRKSIPGASWIFTIDQLESAGAFLATKMNGETLPKDHGYPVRLVVPGWYGCTCIKWVNEISLVAEDVETTSQMKEFADRTHQNGVPQLAREFKPATIDQAAMPIKVEEWKVDGRTKYNVLGVMWGGHKQTRRLQIRFSPDESFVPVETYQQNSNSPWTLWSHRWTPKSPGIYHIQLKIGDSNIPMKRLDEGYYVRAVNITNV
jgi:DMSO/TMAO reductase YedYZ molybdopterin-dependent catalytic subunit